MAFIASFFLKTYTLQRKIVRTGKDGQEIGVEQHDTMELKEATASTGTSEGAAVDQQISQQPAAKAVGANEASATGGAGVDRAGGTVSTERL